MGSVDFTLTFKICYIYFICLPKQEKLESSKYVLFVLGWLVGFVAFTFSFLLLLDNANLLQVSNSWWEKSPQVLVSVLRLVAA